MRRPPVPPRVPQALVFFGLALAAPIARALPPGYSLQLVHTQRAYPTTIRFAPDGRLFYTELFSGRIMVYPNGTAPVPTVWATVPIATGGERGLLGMTFHPDWPDSPYIYVFHSRPNPIYNRVARLRDQGGVGVNYTVLFDSLFANAIGRFGGRMAFGPDRLLYVTIGDCTIQSAAQNTTSLLGKILRLGLTGKPAPPPGNPYGANSPIYAMGVRNPYGLCFDPQTGYGYFTDNGPTCDDELNRLFPAVNYGWGDDDPCGSQPPGAYPAMMNWTPTVGMTGCTTYRSTKYPGYNGNMFLGSYADAAIRRVVFHSTPTTSIVDSVEVWATLPPGEEVHVLDVVQGLDGRIWFSTFDQIWRVLGPESGPVAVEPPSLRERLSVTPNPATGPVTFGLPGSAPFDGLEIVDAAGRRVRHWSGPMPTTVIWDGVEDDGNLARAGVYWVRGTCAGHTVSRRWVRIAH
jgi:glucose/arabinose dehydrogenase